MWQDWGEAEAAKSRQTSDFPESAKAVKQHSRCSQAPGSRNPGTGPHTRSPALTVSI